jgi:type IV pilus assembly protein PilQ
MKIQSLETKSGFAHLLLWLLIFIAGIYFLSFAQEEQAAAPVEEAQGAQGAPAPIKDSLAAAENVTLDFKDAEIHNVLKILSQKSGINIVATPDVMGTITIKLVDVPWDRALDVILKSNGFGYQKQGNVILVTKIENMSKIQADEPLRTEIIDLKFLDAQDAMRILIPMLSPRGKVSVLYNRGQKGWKFGSFKIGKEEVSARALEREAVGAAQTEIVSFDKNAGGGVTSTKVETEPSIKSKTIIITDTDGVLDRIKNVILPQVDRKPKQVLVEARIMEVSRDKLKDIGFDYGTGTDGATLTTITQLDLQRNGSGKVQSSLGGNLLGSQITPSNFSPKALAIKGLVTGPYNTGLNLLYKKLTGEQFEVMLHALEEQVHANTLSAPRIVTLDNQEASMLVGYHTPILSSTITAGSSTEGPTQTQTLDYYQEIGIRLNVVPQVSEEGYINMIIHPSITSSSSHVTATNVAGASNATAISTTVDYPIIDVREVQTQILMKDGETIVIGGLLKDIKSKSIVGVPFLSKIPILGSFFQRETYVNSKIDLLIFITAHVIKDDEFSPAEIARIENRLSENSVAEAPEAHLKKTGKK